MLRRAVKRASSMLGVARPSPHKKISRFWQVMGIAGFTVGALSFVTALALGQGYLRSAPKVPQPGSGRIYRYEEHGAIVYITKREQLLITSFFAVFFIGLGVFGYVVAYKVIGTDKNS
jgi:hypothetical protein